MAHNLVFEQGIGGDFGSEGSVPTNTTDVRHAKKGTGEIQRTAMYSNDLLTENCRAVLVFRLLNMIIYTIPMIYYMFTTSL